MRDDHFKHLALSFMVCMVLLSFARFSRVFILISIIITLAIGIIKEVIDRETTGFSLSDIAFDIAGISLAVLLYVR